MRGEKHVLYTCICGRSKLVAIAKKSTVDCQFTFQYKSRDRRHVGRRSIRGKLMTMLKIQLCIIL